MNRTPFTALLCPPRGPAAAVLACLLALLSLLYAAKGFTYLALQPEAPTDFHLRWVEVRYLLAGRNPNDAFYAHNAQHLRQPLWTPRDESPLPEIGAPRMSCYPPWGIATGLLFYWPRDIHAACWYFAGWNALAIAVLFAMGWRLGRPHGRWEALALGFSGTAISSISTAMGIGQCSVVLTAALALCLLALERRRGTAGALWLGIAAAKPILSGPFGLAFLIPWRMRALLVLAAFFIVVNGLVWWATGASPVEMVVQMLRGGQTFVHDSYGPLNALIYFGVPPVAAQLIAALGSLAAAAILIALWRNAPLLVTFAIASVAARLWSYHHLYDNIVLVFLLAALGELAWRRPSPAATAAFLAAGLSLWAPGKLSDLLPFQIFQMLAWVLGLAFLLASTPRTPASLGAGEHGR